MKFIRLRGVWTHTCAHACKHTQAAWRPTAGPGLNYWWRWLINLWKWLSHMPDLFFNLTQLLPTPLPPQRNNRSITPFYHLTEREKKGSDWKGFPASWCCVSGLSVRWETLMDCRGRKSIAHTHAKSLLGTETLPCCFSQEPLLCCCVLGFINIQ